MEDDSDLFPFFNSSLSYLRCSIVALFCLVQGELLSCAIEINVLLVHFTVRCLNVQHVALPSLDPSPASTRLLASSNYGFCEHFFGFKTMVAMPHTTLITMCA